MLNSINKKLKPFWAWRKDSKIYPNITVVDENDTVVGYMQLFDAIKKGCIRRVSCVLLFNEQGEVLLQRRAAHVLSPNVLDYSAAGHVDEGDTYDEAARRELQEELNLKDISLTLITPPFRTSRFFNGIYQGTIGSRHLIQPNPEEVAEVFWMPFQEFVYEIENNPHKFTASFVEVWHHLRDKISV